MCFTNIYMDFSKIDLKVFCENQAILANEYKKQKDIKRSIKRIMSSQYFLKEPLSKEQMKNRLENTIPNIEEIVLKENSDGFLYFEPFH